MEASHEVRAPDMAEIDGAISNLGVAIRNLLTQLDGLGWTEDQAATYIQTYLMRHMQSSFMAA